MNDNILLLGALAVAWFFSNNKKEKYTFDEYIAQKELEGMFCELNEPITFYMTKAHLPYGQIQDQKDISLYGEAKTYAPHNITTGREVPSRVTTRNEVPSPHETSTLSCATAIESPITERSRFKHVPYIPRYNDYEFFNGLEHHTATNSSVPVNLLQSGYEAHPETHALEKYRPEVSLEYLNFRHPLATTKLGPLGFSSGEYSVPTSGNSKPGYKTMGDLGVHKPEESMLDYISRSTFDVDVRNHAYTLDYYPQRIMNYHDSVDYYNDATLRHRESIQNSAMNMQNKFAHLRQMYPMYRHSQINRGQQMF